MPKSVSTRSAYKMLTCIYLCRTLLFFAPYADFYQININKKGLPQNGKPLSFYHEYIHTIQPTELLPAVMMMVI